MPTENLDPQSIVTEGKFAGLTVQQVLDYAASVDEAIRTNAAPPEPPKVAKPAGKTAGKTPEEILAEHASGRVDNATLLTWGRLEADDEAAFAVSVPDYEKFKAEIQKIKDGMHPSMRISRGIHKQIYEMVKLKSPELQDLIYGTKTAVIEETEEEKLAREAAEAEALAARPATPPAQAPPPPPAPRPRATPPAAPPTPGARAAAPPPGKRVAKLKANAKIEAAAKAWGVPVEEYLLQLEDQGHTQESIETVSQPKTDRQSYGSKAYGRSRAS